MKVYIRAYRGRGVGGHFIKWYTFGGYSHVSLVFVHNDRPAQEIESLQGQGVHSMAFIENPETVLYKVPCSLEQARLIYAEATSLLGAKYDWTGIWGFLRRRKRENPDKWFCSELVAHCLEAAGFILLRLPVWKQSPVLVCASPAIEMVYEI